jgi:hypothetical protein
MTSKVDPKEPVKETALERATREYYDSMTPEEAAEENELAEAFSRYSDEIDVDENY